MSEKPILLIPIAGFGSRFVDAGFTTPKQMLIPTGQSLSCLEISLASVSLEKFEPIFIIRKAQAEAGFIQFIERVTNHSAKTLTISNPTRGSVETCLALDELLGEGDADRRLFIFTMDVAFEPILTGKEFGDVYDGGVLTFKSNSANYSYAKHDGNLVLQTEEKVPISNSALVGIYYFKSGKNFIRYAREFIENGQTRNGEYYLAPLYNLLISDGKKIAHKEVSKMHVFGTPSEYSFFEKYTLVSKKKQKVIGLASDHSGFETKSRLIASLKSIGQPFIDYGTFSNSDTDYSSFVESASRARQRGECDYVFASCRSGQGVMIAGSKFQGNIPAFIHSVESAKLAVEHNCANFFSFSESIWANKTEEALLEAVRLVVNSSFDGGRHQLRIMSSLEGEKRA
jgi:RpiB/LacA/LacB family sugar-phosphate isomerase